VALANGATDLSRALGAIHDLFRQAPLLGSLIQPTGGDLIHPVRVARIEATLEVVIERARTAEPERAEGAIAARGLADAVSLLHKHYTLVATNVPFLGRGEQSSDLSKYVEQRFPDSKACLSTTMLDRIQRFLDIGSTAATVTKQEWCFLVSYQAFRKRLLATFSFNFFVFLGEEAWEAFGQRGPLATLSSFTNVAPQRQRAHFAIDVTSTNRREDKISKIQSQAPTFIEQIEQIENPDSRISCAKIERETLLEAYCQAFQGSITGDGKRFRRQFWEIKLPSREWVFFQSTPKPAAPFSGREGVLQWKKDGSNFARKQGLSAIGRNGIVITQFRTLTSAHYFGDYFVNNISALVPTRASHLTPVIGFCESEAYKNEVKKRSIIKKMLQKPPSPKYHFRFTNGRSW
jgi:hypothetical protein